MNTEQTSKNIFMYTLFKVLNLLKEYFKAKKKLQTRKFCNNPCPSVHELKTLQ